MWGFASSVTILPKTLEVFFLKLGKHDKVIGRIVSTVSSYDPTSPSLLHFSTSTRFLRQIRNGNELDKGVSWFVWSSFLVQCWFFLLYFVLDGLKKTDNEDDIYGGSTDDESGEPNQNYKTKKASSPLTPKESSSSDRDTEDELKRWVC